MQHVYARSTVRKNRNVYRSGYRSKEHIPCYYPFLYSGDFVRISSRLPGFFPFCFSFAPYRSTTTTLFRNVIRTGWKMSTPVGAFADIVLRGVPSSLLPFVRTSAADPSRADVWDGLAYSERRVRSRAADDCCWTIMANGANVFWVRVIFFFIESANTCFNDRRFLDPKRIATSVSVRVLSADRTLNDRSSSGCCHRTCAYGTYIVPVTAIDGDCLRKATAARCRVDINRARWSSSVAVLLIFHRSNNYVRGLRSTRHASDAPGFSRVINRNVLMTVIRWYYDVHSVVRLSWIVLKSTFVMGLYITVTR